MAAEGARLIRYSVLGPLAVVRDGESITVGSERQRALLSILVAHAGETVSVDRIVEALWEGRSPSDPAAAVQTHVSRLRRLLGPDAIVTEAAGYRLTIKDAGIDAVEFEQLVSEARGLLADDPRTALRMLDDALRMWRGAAHGEFADRDFARPASAGLEETRESAQEDRAQALLDLGSAAEAVAALESQIVRRPLRERCHSLLMQALYADGRPTEALEVYRSYSTRLGEERGLEPSTALRDLEAAILRHDLPAPTDHRVRGTDIGMDSDAASIRSSTKGHTAGREPPIPVTSLLGREGDLLAVSEMLEGARVVTITGTGGVGKTRLAQHAALAAHDRYPDGVRWCALATATDADVADAVTSSLGAELRAGTSAADRAVEFLRPRRALIVVDGAEHVLAAVADLVAAIATGTRETDVLVTSREPLGIEGEQLLPLAPLAPPSDSVAPADSPAVALFCDRARSARRHEAGDLDDLDLIAEICRKLDGLPLAIELAAARTRSMTVAEISEGLSERFRLLTRHRRASGGRQRSLRATIDWSYDLLDREAQELFCSLSVFNSEFTLDAAVAVAAPPGAQSSEWQDRVLDLVDRSLVVERRQNGRTRYALLENLRAYGEAQLDAGRRAELEAKHAQHYLRVVADAEPALRSTENPATSATLDEDHTELREVHQHLCGNGEPQRLLDLWSPLQWYLWGRMRSDVYLLVAQAAEQLITFGINDPRVATVAGIAAMGAWQSGDSERARELATAGLTTDDAGAVAPCEESLGDLELLAGNLEAADRWYQRAHDHSAEAGDELHRVLSLSDRSLVPAYAGDGLEADRRSAEALDAAERLDHPTTLAMAHYCAGEVRTEVDTDAALEHLERAIELARQCDLGFVHGVALLSAVTLQGRSGDLAGALARYPALVEHWTRAGNWTQQWTTLRNLAELLVRSGHDRAGAVLLGASWRASEGGAAFGAEAERLTEAREVLMGRLGEDATVEATTEGAAFDGPRAVRFARATLASAGFG